MFFGYNKQDEIAAIVSRYRKIILGKVALRFQEAIITSQAIAP